jgi:hypothetical protein
MTIAKVNTLVFFIGFSFKIARLPLFEDYGGSFHEQSAALTQKYIVVF